MWQNTIWTFLYQVEELQEWKSGQRKSSSRQDGDEEEEEGEGEEKDNDAQDVDTVAIYKQILEILKPGETVLKVLVMEVLVSLQICVLFLLFLLLISLPSSRLTSFLLHKHSSSSSSALAGIETSGWWSEVTVSQQSLGETKEGKQRGEGTVQLAHNLLWLW